MPSAPLDLLLYTRPGCHLCDEMKAVVVPVASQCGATLRLVDISADEALERSFGEQIPVLFVNGRKAFKYRVTDAELRRRLRHG